MARLLDCFSGFIAYGLALDASVAAGRPLPTLAAAQHKALQLLDTARAAAEASGTPAPQVEPAVFAMVAWIDEILARHPEASAAAGAGNSPAPLQAQLFNSNNAHSEFFHHLSALGAQDDDVREVYWHALVLGFKGQYYFEDGDQGELGKLKDLHGRQLQLRPLAADSLAHDRITPQPYSVPDPRGPNDTRRRDRTLLRTGAALALLLPLLYLLWLWSTGPPAAVSALSQRIDQHLQTFACADLSATVDAEGRTRVSGFVSVPGDLPRVEREVSAMPGVKSPRFDIGLRVWPHCEVFAILKPYQARNRERAYGLDIDSPSALEGKLREGDPVRVQVVAPRHDSYIWVDYYTADGSVMHLNAGQAPTQLRAGETLTLGREIPSSWLVSPPFGSVLITVLSAPTPFTETADRPPFELASDYLLRLRETVAASKNSDRLIADFVFLETVSR
ncbi:MULTISPECIES: DotU family type IV/VI secretion system protein [Variovorax]|jgi:type IV/VI secretion system ImpK/VasF family protein|uniref:DotU family type IV/VI secretion system protein n=1 Tax=Variovorax TaxID=34072 RepID=UPI000868BA3C|nr:MULTISPECIES: DotU family type IV/VI secretion system protein [Variovorax]MBN8755504.1 DotU family type IV/VI secretion system protein [Variovorax sp.]ODU14132.1 MAG: type IV / vi secretion system, dotu [Variovorax sp. SCN 67-85]ODV19911.1 MAG: type IV / vi secretion system, dotu [Variovorax sp. SCN 67-20]OJZ12609.1 MAG: type IV / vi secretion system, dotu [Variovorax sp. 67-131]UKI09354.1 DotU family type IV/VI secretion system protein [Variovorax paradoxus]